MGFYTHTFHVWYIHLHMIYYVKCRFLIPFETYDIVKMGQHLLTLGVQIQQEMTASTSASGLNFSAGPQIWISPAEACWY